MIDTKDFKPKTIFKESPRISPAATFPIGLDIGYGSVKALSPLWQIAFPSYAVEFKPSGPTFGKLEDSYITYQDLDTGKSYYVGETAIKSLGDSTNVTEDELFTRDRYLQPAYRVLFDVAIGLATKSNVYGSHGDKKIKVQMGLPPAWLDDTEEYNKTLCGDHNFTIRQGDNTPLTYHLHFTREDFGYMSQPLGTLISCVMDNNGKMTDAGKEIMSGTVDILDGGHNTLDNFLLINHASQNSRTFDSFGMRQVYANTINRIKQEYGVKCTFASLQSDLATGTVTYFDRRNMESYKVSFEKILAEESSKLCQEAIFAINAIIPFKEIKYLVITGGTGAAWADQIKERLGHYESLKVVMGNETDPTLPLTFSNVRGYYYSLYNSLVAKAAA